MIARRIALWAVPIALVAALVWSVLAPRTPPERSPGPAPPPAAQEEPGGAPPSPSPDAARPPGSESPRGSGGVAPYGEIHLGDLVGTDPSGHKRWQITADQVTLAQGRQVVLLRGVRATFYASNGTTMTVTGQNGRFDTKSREVDLEGSVHGMSSSGREVFADQLHYSPKADEVTGIGHVRLIEEHVIMYADRMVSKPTLDQTRFFGHVHIAVR
jgi:LPS export ABC transporter protein LptC